MGIWSSLIQAALTAALFASLSGGLPTLDSLNFRRNDEEGLHRRRVGLVADEELLEVPQDLASSTFKGCLDFANYNVFGRPFWIAHDGQYERAERIPEHLVEAIPTLDIVSFNEAFTTYGRKVMRDNLKTYGFHYFTTVDPIFGKLKVVDSGVFIASRWPIVEEKHKLYDACHLDDCGAAKSVIYAKIEVEPQKYVHVFATHMQAWNNEKGFEIRQKQAAEFRSFILELDLPLGDPVVLMGDFNEDRVNTPSQVDTLLSILGASMLPETGISKYTSDPETNKLVGMTGESVGCSESYDKAQRHCTCCAKEWLDYVLVLNGPGRPVPTNSSSIRVVPLKAKSPFKACMGATLQPWNVHPDSIMCEYTRWLTDLSDHYPVHARVCF